MPAYKKYKQICQKHAGQSVVQMSNYQHGGLEYAIKFYVSRAAFDAECALYSQRNTAHVTELAQFLPQVCFNLYLYSLVVTAVAFLELCIAEAATQMRMESDACVTHSTALQVRNVEDNADKRIKDLMGHPLPPCIVMERGESLNIWAQRAQPDRAQAFMVCHLLYSVNFTQ